MFRYAPSLILMGFVLLSPNLSAQDPPVSGDPAADPTADLIPGSFRTYVVIDNRYPAPPPDPNASPDAEPRRDVRDRTGFLHDSITDNGLNPFVMIVAKTLPGAPDTPLGKLLVALEGPPEKYATQKMGVFAIFLNLDDSYPQDLYREKAVNAVQALAPVFQPNHVVFSISALQVTQGDVEVAQKVVNPDLTKFGIDPNDEVTVIFAHKLKILDRWAFNTDNPLTDEAIAEILAAVDQELQPLQSGSR